MKIVICPLRLCRFSLWGVASVIFEYKKARSMAGSFSIAAISYSQGAAFLQCSLRPYKWVRWDAQCSSYASVVQSALESGGFVRFAVCEDWLRI